LYMYQPKGFEVKGKEDWVWRLNKSLYGTKQAPRCWQARFKVFFHRLGFKETSADDSVYTIDRDGSKMVISTHVDDGLVCSSSTIIKEWFKVELSKEFKHSWVDKPTLYCGVEIQYGTDWVAIRQTHYWKQVLRDFGMEDCNPAVTPTSSGAILVAATEEEAKKAEGLPYRQIVGSISWGAMGTRPDLAYIASVLGRHNAKHSESHWLAAKHVLRYIKGTIDLALVYQRQKGDLRVEEAQRHWSDADWAGCHDTRRSTTGYLFSLAGGAICWASTRQVSVALSTTEAEYMALGEASKHAVWLSRLLGDLGYPVDTVEIMGDNRGSLFLSQDPVFHKRTKHIDIRHHFIRDLVNGKRIKLSHVPTSEMAADCLTKALTGQAGVVSFKDRFATDFCLRGDVRVSLGKHQSRLRSRTLAVTAACCLPRLSP